MKIINVLLKNKQKKPPATLYLLTNKVITGHPAIQNLKGIEEVNRERLVQPFSPCKYSLWSSCFQQIPKNNTWPSNTRLGVYQRRVRVALQACISVISNRSAHPVITYLRSHSGCQHFAPNTVFASVEYLSERDETITVSNLFFLPLWHRSGTLQQSGRNEAAPTEKSKRDTASLTLFQLRQPS